MTMTTSSICLNVPSFVRQDLLEMPSSHLDNAEFIFNS